MPTEQAELAGELRRSLDKQLSAIRLCARSARRRSWWHRSARPPLDTLISITDSATRTLDRLAQVYGIEDGQ